MRVSPKMLGIAVGLLFFFFLPYFVDPFYVRIAREIFIFAIFALSIDILLGFVGLPTLGQAGISGFASYGVAILGVTYGMGPIVASLVALLATAGLSLVFGLLSVRTRGTYFLLITLAQGMIVWGLATRWTSVTGGQNGLPGMARPSLLQQYWAYYWFVLGVFILALVAVRHLTRSPFGLTLQGIKASESRMRTLGYNVMLHRLTAFVVSGTLAGLAGVLLVFNSRFVSPASTDLARSAEGLLMVILGGPGTLTGSAIGAAFVVLTRNLVSIWTDRWLLIMGLGFVIVVLLAPNGIVPALRSRRGSSPTPGNRGGRRRQVDGSSHDEAVSTDEKLLS